MVVSTIINSNNYDNNGLGFYMFAYYQRTCKDDTLTPKNALGFQEA